MKQKFLCLMLSVLALTLCAMPAGASSPELVTVHVGENTAPVAENKTVETYMGVSVSGTLSAMDPDGDDVNWSLVTSPRKGKAEVKADGSFTYTPKEKKRGRDSFSVTARDAFGGISNVAQVTVTIHRQETAVTYGDTRGTGAEYGALYLAEKGIYTGEKVGETWLFHPGRQVERGEFIAMCVCLTGKEPIEETAISGSEANEAIPVWLRPYTSAASFAGMTTVGGGETTLRADMPLTRAEAAVILSSALKLTDVTGGEVDSCPAWAAQACRNAVECGIMERGDYETLLTMGEAAGMLAAAGAVMEHR